MEDSRLEAELLSYDEHIQDLIKDLLGEFFKGKESDISQAALAVRRKRLLREKESLNERRKDINKSLRQLEQELEALEGEAMEIETEVFDEYLYKCRTIPQEERTPENLSIREHAADAGIPVEEFIERLNEEYETNWRGYYDEPDEE